MTDPVLEQIGLSEKEAALYETLLKFGAQPAGSLAKRAKLNRATTYNVLETLLQKGLVAKYGKKHTTYFSAQEPRHLLSYLDHKKIDIEKQKELVNNSLARFYQLVNPAGFRPHISHFEGKEGVRTLIENTLTAKNKQLFGILSIMDLTEVLGAKFFDDYIAKRIKKNIKLNVLRAEIKDLPHKYPSSKMEFREWRKIPEGVAFDLSMYIYDNKVALISSKEEGFGLLIESKEFAKMQRTFFNTLWQISNPQLMK